METVNPPQTTPKPLPDAVMVELGEAITATRDDLRALDPVVETLLTRFQRTHDSLVATLNARRNRQALLRPLRDVRDTSRQRLVDAVGEIWDEVPRVNATRTSRKPREKVKAERADLFRYGKPTLRSPSAARLIEMANEAVEILAGDSPLARAWPPDQVEELRLALAEYTTTSRSVRTGVMARLVSVEQLNRDRSQWMIDFTCLRDTTLTLAGARGESARWKLVFADNRPGRPAPEVEEDPGPPDPPPNP